MPEREGASICAKTDISTHPSHYKQQYPVSDVLPGHYNQALLLML